MKHMDRGRDFYAYRSRAFSVVGDVLAAAAIIAGGSILTAFATLI
jgi:hypothetical protein